MKIGHLMAAGAVVTALVLQPRSLVGALPIPLVMFVIYWIWAYTHPYVDCWRCSGAGTNRMSTFKRQGRCWRCKGSRKLTTIGYRVTQWMFRGVGRTVSEVRGKGRQ